MPNFEKGRISQPKTQQTNQPWITEYSWYQLHFILYIQMKETVKNISFSCPSKQLSRCCINFPHELTYQIDSHSRARSMYSHVITKFSRMGRLPRFLSYGAPPKRGASRRAWSSANSEGGLLCWLPWSSFTDKRSEVLFFVYIFFLHESGKRCLGYLSKKSELNSLKLSRDNRKIVVFKISWFGTILSKQKLAGSSRFQGWPGARKLLSVNITSKTTPSKASTLAHMASLLLHVRG